LLAVHDSTVLTAAIVIGSCVLGCTPLTITIVPSDSVPRDSLARAIGLTSASSAIVGGVVMPSIAGRLADTHGLQMPLWITMGAMIIGIATAAALQKVPTSAHMNIDTPQLAGVSQR
jgi:MFS family permease